MEASAPHVPVATTTRFVMLIVAVVASGAFVFLDFYAHLPGKAQQVITVSNACDAQLEADPAMTRPLETLADVEIREAAIRRWQLCHLPLLLDQVVVIGAGLIGLFGLATASYLLHPWWLIRRLRLRPLSVATSPNLMASLEQLRRDVGLNRPVDWLLAPHARTAGGQAFGFPWRRRVQIDAGLAVMHTVNPPAFRAVVLHELGHLRHRDVDKTYLTVGIWRAFLAVAVIPFVALLAHPALLSTPFQWRWQDSAFANRPRAVGYAFVALLSLTALVYLTRNAILRIRETQADAFAAAHDGPDSAIATALARMPTPRAPSWRRWGTHPLARERLDAVNNPRMLLRAGLWELAGVGLAAGALAGNVGFLLTLYLVTAPLLASATVGLVAGGFMGGLLAVALWRATAHDPVAPPAVRTWLAGPVALAAGFVAGSVLTLQAIDDLPTGLPSLGVGSWLVAALVMATGAVLLAAWVVATARAILAAPRPPRWALPAVVATAVLVAAPWFGVWFYYSHLDAGFAVDGGRPPAVGADIGWYRLVATWSGAGLDPLTRMVRNPLMLPGLTMLWLVPVVAAWRGRRPLSLGRPLVVGLLGGVGAAVVHLAMPFLLRAGLAPQVRSNVDAADIDTLTFSAVYDNTSLAIASLAVAVVIAVVVAIAGQHRPPLALLAASLTVAVSTAAVFLVADPVACYLNVRGASPAPTTCFAVPNPEGVAQVAHWIAVQGLLLAIPAVLLAVVVGALRRRPGPGEPRPWRAQPVTSVVLVGLAVLAAANIAASVLILPWAYEVWLEPLLG